MIAVFVSKEGYYIHGDGVEAALRCSQALDDQGNPIFHELHHTYKVMFLALEIVARKQMIHGDVVVYNDSRIIDELNGSIPPLDDVCQRWRQVIRREIMPRVRSIVLFRKRAQDFIAAKMAGVNNLIVQHDPAVMQELAVKSNQMERERSRSTKARVLDRFKRMWKNDKQQ